MTRAVGDDDSLLKSLQEVVGLFRDAQASVFKLMSSVSRSTHPNPVEGTDDHTGFRPEVPQGTKIRHCSGPTQFRPCGCAGKPVWVVTNGPA